jgi:hypothetical protein
MRDLRASDSRGKISVDLAPNKSDPFLYATDFVFYPDRSEDEARFVVLFFNFHCAEAYRWRQEILPETPKLIASLAELAKAATLVVTNASLYPNQLLHRDQYAIQVVGDM